MAPSWQAAAAVVVAEVAAATVGVAAVAVAAAAVAVVVAVAAVSRHAPKRPAQILNRHQRQVAADLRQDEGVPSCYSSP
jgi:hypothetical protein